MTPFLVCAFPEDEAPARRLALDLAVPFALIFDRKLPDGESLPTVPDAGRVTVLYRSLHHPDGKLLPLLLAADALRRAGAHRLVLVAPYMPYLRQDRVFIPGQPLSRDVFGRLLGERFERIVTVQAHLHRTRRLTDVFSGAEVDNLSACSLLAREVPWRPGSIVVAPDQEAEPWAREMAGVLGGGWTGFVKQRLGDRQVRLTLSEPDRIVGRPAVLVDDVASTGATLEAAARDLRLAGADSICVAVVHALFDAEALARLEAAGVNRVVSSDSAPHPTNAVHLTGLLASALRKETH